MALNSQPVIKYGIKIKNLKLNTYMVSRNLNMASSEYDKRVQLYKDEVWTCQCTGHINLTHEEAFKSEQEKFKILKDQFPQYFEKTVLELIHHSKCIWKKQTLWKLD